MPYARLRRCRRWMNCAANSLASSRHRRRASRGLQPRGPPSSHAFSRPTPEKMPPDSFILYDLQAFWIRIEGTENGQAGKDRRGPVEPHRARSRRTRQAAGRKMGCVRGSGCRRRRGTRGRRGGGAGGGADRIYRDPRGDRRQENRSLQGSARGDWAWLEGGKGSRRSRAQARQGRRDQGRSRKDQGGARKSGRQGGVQVIAALPLRQVDVWQGGGLGEN